MAIEKNDIIINNPIISEIWSEPAAELISKPIPLSATISSAIKTAISVNTTPNLNPANSDGVIEGMITVRNVWILEAPNEWDNLRNPGLISPTDPMMFVTIGKNAAKAPNAILLSIAIAPNHSMNNGNRSIFGTA